MPRAVIVVSVEGGNPRLLSAVILNKDIDRGNGEVHPQGWKSTALLIQSASIWEESWLHRPLPFLALPHVSMSLSSCCASLAPPLFSTTAAPSSSALLAGMVLRNFCFSSCPAGHYELPAVGIISRSNGRQTCTQCKSVFHATERPPKVADKCDRWGGKLFQRDDDRPESIKIRMEAYEQSTAPLIEFYRNLGLLLPIAARGTPEEICEKTFTALNIWRNRNSATAASSRAPESRTPTAC